MVTLEAEAVIGDRYRLCRPLGEGGMGWVWEARDLTSGARRALKFLKRDKADDRRRFQREVRAAAAVRHANVIDVHDFVELPDGTLVMVMDLLEGESLGTAVRRERRIVLPELAAILLPVTSALEAAHAVGIVHRDLKPDNVFLSNENDAIVVKVLDFGAAKLTATDGLAAVTGPDALTNTGSIIGTPYYMSPEQVFSEKDLDERADIWSLGVVLYECLCGSRPTEADTMGQVLKRIMKADFAPISERCEGLPDDVVSMVTRMLSVDRDARPRTVREVHDVLARHAAPRIARFAEAPSNDSVDPAGATLPVSGPSAEGVEVRLRSAAVEPRADTHRSGALSVSVGAPLLRRRTGAVAFAAVAVLVGGVAVRALMTRSPETRVPHSVVSEAPSHVVSNERGIASASAAAPRVVASVIPALASASAPLTAATISPPPVVVNAATRAPAASARRPPAPIATSVATAPSSAPSSVWTER